MNAPCPSSQSGFTLVEVIITLVVGSMLAALLVTVMSVTVVHSPDAVNQERNDFLLAQVLENITKDYVSTENNKTDFTQGLNSTLVTLRTNISNGNYNAVGGQNATVTSFWVVFDAAGTESVDGNPTNTLKVVATMASRTMTTLYSPARADSTSQLVWY